ncbi:MAG TPA: catalase, partial [Casimicrobiaceae bacterium]|nr:catalase [Casimicrobiaceae bacterium]
MATRKPSPPAARSSTRKTAGTRNTPATKSAARSTVSGPSRPARDGAGDAAQAKFAATQALVVALPYNENKALEYGDVSAVPHEGASAEPGDPSVTGSTLTETAASPKVGLGRPPHGVDPGSQPLDRVRTDASGQRLTTNHGVPIGTNQHSLKAGLAGPALLEDFILREKITHFDHERIPERVVHARGSGAHGFFECFEPLTDLTRASLFAEAGKRTPVFVRFSTVVGERGSADTARDVRGFAVKFYTDEGNWDLVGNNIPVFFIQDAMKFPDLVHARGSGAHGFFECYQPLTQYTKAAPFRAAGKVTPVFVRFSTVQGERGSKDTARDVRGFAVKFYTDEGNWDLVGNNIPVFFIQDAMKFP